MRMLSVDGLWEFGLQLKPTGLRLRMGKAGRPPKVLDMCLGRDESVYAPITLAILERLDSLPESCSEQEIDALFPWAGSRPDLNIHLPLLLKHQAA